MELLLRRREMMRISRGFTPILPSEYQEVDYIYTSGNVTLQTSLKFPKTALGFSGAFAFEDSLTTDQYFVADRDTGGVRLGIIGKIVNDIGRVALYTGITAKSEVPKESENIVYFTATVSGSGNNQSQNLKGTINGVPFDSSNTGNIRVYGNNNIKFFDANGSTRLKGKMLGRFTVENPNGLVYRFVPCYRIADLVPGIFETETSSFVGSSSLIKGNDVN